MITNRKVYKLKKVKKDMAKIVLPDTSLCAIVRDELDNPAGGIKDFVDSAMPFLEAGVIVDTGSKDVTRESLEELKTKYPPLKVYDHLFDGFAVSRNFSIKKVQTKKALVLDADERLTKENFKKLTEILRAKPKKYYDFKCLYVYPDRKNKEGFIHNPRLFEISQNLFYEDFLWEHLVYKTLHMGILPPGKEINVWIKHFLPPALGVLGKTEDFYEELEKGRIVVPSETPSFKLWKQRNPKRADY